MKCGACVALLAFWALPALADGGAFPGNPPHSGMTGAAAYYPKAASSGPSLTVTDLSATSNFGATGTVSLTPSHSVAIGELVVVDVYDGNQGGSGAITGTTLGPDSKGNTYTLQQSSGSGFTVSNYQIFTSKLTAALTTSDTIPYHAATGFGTVSLGISAASVNCSVCTADAAVTASASGFSAAFTVTGAGSAAVAGEANFAPYSSNQTATVTSGGWTALSPIFTGTDFMSYQVNAGTSPLTFAGTLSSSAWIVAISGFKP